MAENVYARVISVLFEKGLLATIVGLCGFIKYFIRNYQMNFPSTIHNHNFTLHFSKFVSVKFHIKLCVNPCKITIQMVRKSTITIVNRPRLTR